MKFVEVLWDDATETAEWVEKDKLPGIPRHVTRGWLVKEDERQIVLASTLQLTEGESLGGVVTILQGMVVKKRVLKVGSSMLVKGTLGY